MQGISRLPGNTLELIFFSLMLTASYFRHVFLFQCEVTVYLSKHELGFLGKTCNVFARMCVSPTRMRRTSVVSCSTSRSRSSLPPLEAILQVGAAARYRLEVIRGCGPIGCMRQFTQVLGRSQGRSNPRPRECPFGKLALRPPQRIGCKEPRAAFSGPLVSPCWALQPLDVGGRVVCQPHGSHPGASHNCHKILQISDTIEIQALVES
ncbi:hypothetical protein M432DRAFT_308279 [Thermoascus aurantiacus ATCC 26904]